MTQISGRPLLITDCDEVLLHMMRHFSDWVAEAHDIAFTPQPSDFSQALRHRSTGDIVAADKVWPLLDDFFHSAMHLQTLTPHVIESLGRIGEVADIIVLTNLADSFHQQRVAQLEAVGIRHRVVCNQGEKGPAVASLVAGQQGGPVVFVDDIPSHHSSVARHRPDVWRLHMVADPDFAHLIPPAPKAHKRIDRWAEATPWIMDRLTGGAPATIDDSRT